MKQKESTMAGLVLVCSALGLLIASCRPSVELKPVCGTIESPMAEAPVAEQPDLTAADGSRRIEFQIMSDSVCDVSVWGISEVNGQPTQGCGIVIEKNGQRTVFPDIRHTRQPDASYDNATGQLWLKTSVMEGTGVQVEQLCLMLFDGDRAYVAATADPYDVQQAACRQLGYATDGEQVKFFIDGAPVASVVNTVTDLGGFDADALWIGEQIAYDLAGGQPRVCITPGVRFVGGPVLCYDDMPTFTADVVLTDSGELVINGLRCQAADE